MRQFAAFSIVLLCAVVLLSGCGHNSSNKVGPPAKIVLAVTPASSLSFGGTATVVATVQDSNGNTVVNPKVTFASSNTGLATLSNPTPASSDAAGEATSIGVLLCAGTWNSSFNVCAQPTQGGTSDITATTGSLTSDKVTVFIHPHIDKLLVTPSSVDCISATQTQQMTVQALSNSQGDITSIAGPINWTTSNSVVFTIDTNGLATAQAPGTSQLVASISSSDVPGSGSAANTISMAVRFVTCPVASISLHVKDATDTSFTLDQGQTQTLVADVVDSKGASISPTLNWFNSQPATLTVLNTGAVSTVAAGTSSIVTQCAGSTCNIGLSPIFSNVVSGSVNGTSSTTVYATGTGTTSLVPIDSTNNTAGTAITLPSTPDSMRANATGSKLYLGNSTAIMVVDTASNAVGTIANTPGTVLAVSPDGNLLLIFNSATSTLSLINISGATLASVTTSTAPRGDFSVNSSTAYVVAGTNLYVLTSSGASTITLGAAANDINVTEQGSLYYLAGGAASAVTARATCNNQQVSPVAPTVSTPTLIASLPNATQVLAVDAPNLEVIASTTNGAGCPPSAPNTTTTIDFGQGSFTPQQIIVLPNSSKAYVTSNLGNLLAYDATAGTVSAIPLAGGAQAFTGGATLDSKTVYVGGADNAVHMIDTASGSDSKQISLSFKPDLVVVRPK